MGRRVKGDKAFVRTMQHARELALASRLAAQVYRNLEKAERQHALFRRLVGIAKKALAEGKSKTAVLKLLCRQVVLKNT